MVAVPAQITSGVQSGEQGWLGHLELTYRQRGQRTVLARRRHQGPLLVQRSFHPEGPVCHSYLIHPPGGVVGGDRLRLDVTVAGDADALLTTPAAAKFYRTAGPVARQEQRFSVAAGGGLEFLPMETILHGHSDTALTNHFALAADARLCCWDILCLGRPGSGDAFEGGRCMQDLTVERDGRPVVHERLHLEHGDPVLQRPWGLGGYPALGALVATPAPQGIEAMLREAVAVPDGVRLGVSRIDDVLLLRCLGPGAQVLRGVLEQAWACLREPVIGRPPTPPRIWKT